MMNGHKLSRCFYRRQLPTSCIPFSSVKGKELFGKALQSGHMENYFPLAAQFRTQDEPAFCGLSSLVMVLNALEVDPGRVWKGPWRWYHEDMLDCCIPLEQAAKTGITMDQFCCMARCNTLTSEMFRAEEPNTEEQFRQYIRDVSRGTSKVIVATYSRSSLGQTGDGHFSPLAGFEPEQDLVLVLDTARFKYPPHWVSVSELWRAMLPFDKDTGKPRGYCVLTKSEQHPLLLFCLSTMFRMSEESQSMALNFVRSWTSYLQSSVECTDDSVIYRNALETFLVVIQKHFPPNTALLNTRLNMQICENTLSPEHHCAVQELLDSLAAQPLHAIAREFARENPDQLRAFGALNKDCCAAKISVTAVDIVTAGLLAWPYQQNATGSHGDRLAALIDKDLQNACVLLRNEVEQLSKQLRVVRDYRDTVTLEQS